MDQAEKLSVTVTAEQARRIREMVQSGAYASSSEVIRAGLRSLERDEEEYQERLESIRQRVKASIEDPNPSMSGEQVKRGLQERFERALLEDAKKSRSGA